MNNIDSINSTPVNTGFIYNEQKAVLNVPEAASYLTICERKLRQLISEHDIKSCRIGRRVVIRRVDLDAFLESQTV